MTMTAEERSFVTKAIFSVAGGLAVLGAGLGVGFEVLERKAAPVPFANSGDTPVVLVGGSMTFKAGAYQTPQPWLTTSANSDYYVTPDYQISTIVLKSYQGPENDTTDGSDANPTTDKLRLDVSTAGTWEIDEFTVAGGNTPVVKIFPKQNGSKTEIHLYLLDGNGMLCPVDNSNMMRVRYSPTKSCPAPAPASPGSPPTAPIFSQVSVRLNNDVAPDGKTPQPTATLNCIDSTPGDPAGKCRIVLKGQP